MTNTTFIPLSAALKLAHPKADPGAAASFAALAVPPPADPSAAPSPCAEVKVELGRDGARITCIRVTCRCGEVIELACDY